MLPWSERYKWAYLLYGIGRWAVFEDEAYEYEKRLIARRDRKQRET